MRLFIAGVPIKSSKILNVPQERKKSIYYVIANQNVQLKQTMHFLENLV